jgi:integrase
MSRVIPETITEEELVKIVSAKGIRENHKVAFMLGFYEAMRVSEVVNQTIDNVDFGQHLIKIKQAKGNKDRNIPIIQPLLLGKHEVVRALKSLPVNCGSRALEIAIKNYGKKILNKDIHFHTLRHSGATWLLNKKKWDIRQVQRHLGHSKIETTTIYTHVNPQDLVALEWGEEK